MENYKKYLWTALGYISIGVLIVTRKQELVKEVVCGIPFMAWLIWTSNKLFK